MKVHFKFGGRTVNGVHYPKGIHEIPSELKNHWFLKGLVDSGDAVIVQEKAEPVSMEPKIPADGPAAEEKKAEIKQPSQPQRKVR